MGLAEVQTLMAKLLADQELLEQAMQDEHWLASQPGLSDEDRLVLKPLLAKSLRDFQRTLVNKRLGYLRSALKRSSHVLGVKFDQIFRRRVARSDVASKRPIEQDVIRMVHAFEREEGLERWHLDLIRWESFSIRWQLSLTGFVCQRLCYDIPKWISDADGSAIPHRRSRWLIRYPSYFQRIKAWFVSN